MLGGITRLLWIFSSLRLHRAENAPLFDHAGHGNPRQNRRLILKGQHNYAVVKIGITVL